MTNKTPLDVAFAAIEHSDADRLRFYERLVDAELFVLLEAEPVGDQISPSLFEVEGTGFVLAFDLEERLAAFAGQTSPYVALSGRALVGMLQGQSLGLGLNLGAPSEYLLPPDVIAWVVATLDNAPEELQARPQELKPPAGLPEGLITGLDTKLALAAGRAHSAYLVQVIYDTGVAGHMLAFIDPAPDAEPALAQAVAEALTFSGVEAGMLDVAFFAASDGMAARLAKVGLRFDLPDPAPEEYKPKPPGSDPDKPPILR
ncbi:SseB family protein [Pseudaestuariivita rosea]|uniref:SseB family protein n=1 Tax=Pseudaestuariivita rosea TaxID=2763263 RepID=UPI001ABBBF83|nr:SseB family protein [Pseudaestuariivita rosea]